MKCVARVVCVCVCVGVSVHLDAVRPMRCAVRGVSCVMGAVRWARRAVVLGDGC